LKPSPQQDDVQVIIPKVLISAATKAPLTHQARVRSTMVLDSEPEEEVLILDTIFVRQSPIWDTSPQRSGDKTKRARKKSPIKHQHMSSGISDD